MIMLPRAQFSKQDAIACLLKMKLFRVHGAIFLLEKQQSIVLRIKWQQETIKVGRSWESLFFTNS